MNENKSLTLTYILALIGGLFGLHHLYLGRIEHAFLWLTTFGGCGLGFIYEFLFLIRTYVDETNRNISIIKQYQMKIIQRKSPCFELVRFCGQYLTAVYYGLITYYAFPPSYLHNRCLSFFIGCLTALAIAFGTQLTGTIGPRQCSFKWPLLGALVGLPLLIYRTDFLPSFNIPALCSSCIFEWKVEWNRMYLSDRISDKCEQLISMKKCKRKPTQHAMKSYVVFAFALVIFSGLFTSAIYQNLQVNINDQRVRVKDVLKECFQSYQFVLIHQQIMNIGRELWQFYLKYGFYGLWTQIYLTIESENERKFYEILHLRYDASQRQIESQCRILSRQWHPDRYRNVDDKQNAQILFINIQQACDRLSNERKRRQSHHTQK